ncbi:MAG: hypothetical protein U9M90_02795 [Patescibacteria group bacterium]|nr:hypothetical protein [Patescibacteria group bacterium]
MDLYYFFKSSYKDALITIIIGIVAFVIVLVTTLNMISAVIVFLLFAAVAIFQKSFSRGWLFLLLILLLFPSMKISGAAFTIHDIFLIILAIISLEMILAENTKVSLAAISYYLFLFELIGLSIILFAKIFGQQPDPFVLIIVITIATYWIITAAFQYFFQTQKRLRRFFVLLITIGVIHSMFGLITFGFGFQTPTGLGITSGKTQFLAFENVKYQINGFLGDGYSLRVGNNALAPFLLVTIPLTYALLLNTRKRKKCTRPLKKIEKTVRFFDSASFSKRTNFFSGSLIQKIKHGMNKQKIKKIFSGRMFFGILIAIQAIALVFTFSYVSLIIAAIGIFAMGILLRNKKLILFMAAIIVALALVLPGTFSTVIKESEINAARWFSGWESVQDHWIWGSGWKIGSDESHGAESIKNSYILIWKYFGILGIAVFAIILWKYFRELYGNYRKSDGEKRIWLIGILAIFLEFLFLGFISNSFFFGPAAIVFWLLFGAIENLKYKQIVFGLTETHLTQKHRLL